MARLPKARFLNFELSVKNSLGYDEKHGTLKARLSGRGRSMFRQLDSELNFGFRQCGSMVLAFHEEEL